MTDASNLPDPLENYRQVCMYIRWLGYKCGDHRAETAVKRNELSPRRGGGFTKASVRTFVKRHLSKRVMATGAPTEDRPANPDVPEVVDGPAAEKAFHQARHLRITADKAELAYQRELGTLVPAADQAITLASFAAVIEHELKSQFRTRATKLLTLVQGDSARKAIFVRELTDLVDEALRHAAEVEEYRVQFEALGAVD